MKKNGIKLTYKNFWIFENKIKKNTKIFYLFLIRKSVLCFEQHFLNKNKNEEKKNLPFISI